MFNLKTIFPFFLIAFLLGAGCGLYLKKYLDKPVEFKCPDLKCPPNVTVQQLDMSEIKRIKGDFNYQPTFSGTIIFTDSCR